MGKTENIGNQIGGLPNILTDAVIGFEGFNELYLKDFDSRLSLLTNDFSSSNAKKLLGEIKTALDMINAENSLVEFTKKGEYNKAVIKLNLIRIKIKLLIYQNSENIDTDTLEQKLINIEAYISRISTDPYSLATLRKSIASLRSVHQIQKNDLDFYSNRAEKLISKNLPQILRNIDIVQRYLALKNLYEQVDHYQISEISRNNLNTLIEKNFNEGLVQLKNFDYFALILASNLGFVDKFLTLKQLYQKRIEESKTLIRLSFDRKTFAKQMTKVYKNACHQNILQLLDFIINENQERVLDFPEDFFVSLEPTEKVIIEYYFSVLSNVLENEENPDLKKQNPQKYSILSPAYRKYLKMVTTIKKEKFTTGSILSKINQKIEDSDLKNRVENIYLK